MYSLGSQFVSFAFDATGGANVCSSCGCEPENKNMTSGPLVLPVVAAVTDSGSASLTSTSFISMSYRSVKTDSATDSQQTVISPWREDGVGYENDPETQELFGRGEMMLTLLVYQSHRTECVDVIWQRLNLHVYAFAYLSLH